LDNADGALYPTELRPSLFDSPWDCGSYSVLKQIQSGNPPKFVVHVPQAAARSTVIAESENLNALKEENVKRFTTLKSWHKHHQVLPNDEGYYVNQILQTKTVKLVLQKLGKGAPNDLSEGDFIVEINGEDVSSADVESANMLLTQNPDGANLTVMRSTQPDAEHCAFYWSIREQIRFAPELVALAQQFAESNNLGRYIAVHWRHGDAALRMPDQLLYSGGTISDHFCLCDHTH
jgi:hypothetical protein